MVGRQEGHPVCKKQSGWYTGVVICLERGAAAAAAAAAEARGADLHMAQLMPLPFIISCFSKIQIDFTFLGSPGQRAFKLACVWPFTSISCMCMGDDMPKIESQVQRLMQKSWRDSEGDIAVRRVPMETPLWLTSD